MSTIPTETNLDKLGVRLSAGSVVRTGEPLARHTTLRVGGPAELYVEPALESDLAETLRYPASAARIRAQERMPLWKLLSSYFSFGE